MTIFGLDFSHYDAVPAGALVVSEGFSFMTHKAGGDKDDAELGAWWSALKGQRDKVLLGAYWVLYPGNPTGRADAFLARLDSQCPGWRDGPFILQLDCEIWNGDSSTKPGKGDIKAACDRLVAKMPKLRPIVYASAGQYGNSLNGLGYPLWNARYPSSAVTTASGVYALVGGDSGSGWDSYSGQVPAIWQFTSSATALGQSTCDANAYRGTLDQLTALLAPGWAEDMPLSDDDIAAVATAIWNYKLTDPYDTATPPRQVVAGTWLRYTGSRNLVDPDLPQTDGVALLLKQMADRPQVDQAALTSAITSGVLAGFDAAAIAAAIPADLAAQVADELARRLSA